MRIHGLRMLALVCAFAIVHSAEAQAQTTTGWASTPPPPDPFAGHYALPKAREVGTTAGQFRMIGSAMLALGGKAPEFGLQGTLELMTFAYLGVRGTLQTTLVGPDSEPLVFEAKTGPSLHLLPYHHVDLSVFFEGGVAVVDPTQKGSTPMPIASPGATLELWLSHWMFLRGEGHLDAGLYEQHGASRRYVRVGCLLGLGIAL